MLPIKLFIVGGETVAAKRLAKSLGRQGYDVVGMSSSGEMALEIISKIRPNLVLMDVRLTGEMDGIETAGRMLTSLGVPVIFLTAKADAEGLERATTVEPFGYLTRPYRIADLVSAITIALQKHQVVRDLKERETWLAATLGSAGDAVVVTDVSGRIRFLNQIAREVFDVSELEVIGRPWSDVLHLQSKITGLPTGDLVQITILQGTTLDVGKDLKVTTSLGETHEVEGEIALCKVDDTILGTVFTFRDVTLRNRNEHQTQQELRNQAVAQLAGAISNQVSNLLQMALTQSDQALSQIEADHHVRSSIEEIKARLEDMFRIAHQLFALHNNAASFPQVFDLNAVVCEACAILREGLSPEIDLVTDLSLSLGEIRADSDQIRRAIVSLVGYSLARMPDGGEVRIKSGNCALEKRVRDGEIERYVTLTVVDTGPGMRADQARRLFDPFSSSDASGGLDISLFVVHNIIADARGSISALTGPDKGITFEILLPMAAEARASAPSYEAAPGKEVTILLVEPDPAIRSFVGNSLQREGYELLGASNCGEAVSLMEHYEAPIGLLITNMVMPEMSGPELAQQLSLTHSGLAMVFIADQPVDPSLKQTWLDQRARFIQKPFRQEELNEVVHEVLQSSAVGSRVGSGGSIIS